MSLIQVTNAAFRYDGKEVVSGLNFSVNDCDYLCIVGENGSGKSAILTALCVTLVRAPRLPPRARRAAGLS